MGLLDPLRGDVRTGLSPKAAMLVACISMMGADGQIDDDEANIVSRIDGGEQSADWELALRTWEEVTDPKECIDLVAPCLNDQQREFTFANLVDIAMAADGLADPERQLIEGYMIAFDLDVDFVDAVLKVIIAKNNRAPFLS